MNVENINNEYNIYKPYYNQYIKDIKQYEYKYLFRNPEINKKIEQEINDIQKQYLYQSDTHGISHNRKVAIFAYFICLYEKIYGDDYKIIMDGCKYHDVGRIDDEEDAQHGIRSALKLDKIVGSETFYKGENLDYLKAIVELHSNSDSDNKKYFEQNNLTDYDRFCRLYKVLKDADGLDRVRLYEDYPFINWLNPSMLRTSTAKKLVKFAHQLNYEYRKGNVLALSLDKC